ncbi:hypothetical protein KSF78_0008835 [Schistosoma japonicum]|nr:hypothetical protein KSF78_0008835 [Schistosoma japonicum]
MYGLLIDEYSAHQQIGMNKDSTSINTMPEILILDTFPFSSSQVSDCSMLYDLVMT